MVSSRRIITPDMLTTARFPLLWMTLQEVLRDVPEADGGEHRLVQQLDAERDAIIDCMHTDDFRVAIAKFLKKGK